jgi:Spy/CpxP family protein refolding chaperone
MKKLCTAFVATALIVGCQSGSTTSKPKPPPPPPPQPEKKMDGDNAGKADATKTDPKADDKKGG